MNALKRVVWLACALAAVAGPAAAQAPEEQAVRRERLRERWETMSPEERQAARQRLREQREDVSSEERAARRQQLRERWRQMSPEERQRLRRDFEEAGRGQPGGHPPRPHPENGGRFPRRP